MCAALDLSESINACSCTEREPSCAADATAAAEDAVAGDSAAAVAYMAAHAAEAMTPGGFAAERRLQSQWLAERLGV